MDIHDWIVYLLIYGDPGCQYLIIIIDIQNPQFDYKDS